MFFSTSKIIWFFLQPLNLAIVLLALAVLVGYFGWRRLAGTITLVPLVILLLSAWTSFGALLIGPLEARFVRPDPPARVAGIIVLGGGFEGAINRARGGYEMNSGGDRYVEAAVLARRYPEARIVISGGNGSLLLAGEGDGATAPKLFASLGIPASRLVLENESRNTSENVANIRELVRPAPDDNWLLVTSAFHMPRAMGLFRKAGFPVVPWPVDYRTSGEEGIGFFRDNAMDALQTTTTAFREWCGLVAYKFTGRIDSVFPAPQN